MFVFRQVLLCVLANTLSMALAVLVLVIVIVFFLFVLNKMIMYTFKNHFMKR